jgi:hypothetical protein
MNVCHVRGGIVLYLKKLQAFVMVDISIRC